MSGRYHSRSSHGNHLVSNERIATHREVIDQQAVQRIENEGEVGRHVPAKWSEWSDEEDEQRGSAQHDAHAGDQSKIYPLFGEWVVGRSGFFLRILIQASLLTLKPLQILPGLLGVFAEDHDVVLALIEIKTQARLDVAFALDERSHW